MKRWIAFFTLALFISSCGVIGKRDNPAPENPNPGSETQPAIVTPAPTPILPPELSGDVEIQQLMLKSSERWKTIQATYTITQFPEPGSAEEMQISSSQFWIRQPAEFKVINGAPGGGEVITIISDGQTILRNDETRSEMPPAVSDPFIPPDAPSDTVYPHPLAGYLETPVSDLIFPVGLAQRGGEYRITGQETVASRQAYIVEWGRSPGELIDRFWIDGETGVILRQQNHGKLNSVTPLSDIQATYIVYNKEFAPAMFDVGEAPTPTPTPEASASETSGATVTILPEMLNVRYGPNTGYTVIATLPTGTVLTVIGKTQAEDWWKVQLPDGQEGWVASDYVEFSGEADDVPVTNY